MIPFLLLASGLLLTAGAVTAAAARDSALAVVVDLARTGLVLAALAVPLIALGIRAGRPQARSARPVIGTVALVAALATMAVLAYPSVAVYRSEDIYFRHDGITLAGTLYVPRQTPSAGVVLVHGSGPETREGYEFYARWLAEHGIAALAYDKRGTGESSGELYESTYDDYADDAAAAMAEVASRAGLPEESIGLIGVSEAEWVAPIAAVKSRGPRFVAIIGASGLSPAEQVQAEIAIRLRARGYDDPAVDQALALNERVLAYQRTGQGRENLAAELRKAHSEPWFADAEDIPDEAYAPEDYEWWRSVMDFDPIRAWSQVTAPVLLLKGGADDRSTADVMRQRIAGALAKGGNRRLTVVVFPNADHMLLDWPFGRGVPPPRFADGFLETLLQWITAHSRTRAHEERS